MSMEFKTLRWLYKLQKKKKQELGEGETNPQVSHEELDSMRSDLVHIDYLIGEMIKKLGDERENT